MPVAVRVSHSFGLLKRINKAVCVPNYCQKYPVQTRFYGQAGKDKEQASNGGSNSTKIPKYRFYLCLLGFSLKDYLGRTEKEEEKDSELILMIKRGSLAFHNQEFKKAESLLHVALKYAQELSDEKAVTYIFDILANLAYQTQDFDKAMKLFRSVLQRYASEEEADFFSNEFIAVSLKIANCFAAQKQLTNAIKGFHYSIGSLAERLKMTPPSSHEPNAPLSSINSEDLDCLVLYAMALEQYAGLLASVGQNSTSVLFLKEALRICLAVHGEKHLQTAVLKNQLGAVMARDGKYNESAEEIQSAISIAKEHIKLEEEQTAESWSVWSYLLGSSSEEKKVGPIPHPTPENALSNLATFYINLGSVHLLKGELKEASVCCGEGERISKRALNQEAKEEAAKCLETIRKTREKSNKKRQQSA